MPMVGKKEYPYTAAGKKAAKKAAVAMKTKSAGKKMAKKQNFSGVASQIYS